MSSTGPKQAIYENLAEVAQALGHPHRLELLEHFAQGVRSVEELSARAQSDASPTPPATCRSSGGRASSRPSVAASTFSIGWPAMPKWSR